MVVLYTLDFADAEGVSQGMLRAALPEMAETVRSLAQQKAPVGATKRLSQNISIKIRKAGLEAHIGAFGVRYAHLVLKGTKAHRIDARDKRTEGGRKHVMQIPTAGGFAYRATVMHPGTAPNNFLTAALEESRPEIEAILRAQGEQYLSEAVRRTHGL